jgi:hypothetical protein
MLSFTSLPIPVWPLRGLERCGPHFEAHNHTEKVSYMKQNKALKRETLLEFSFNFTNYLLAVFSANALIS